MDMPGLLAFTRMTGDLVKAMRACPQPIVAAVDGVCAGAGAIMAMASDIRFATPGRKTAFLFTRVGLAGCDMGACAILPRIIGHGRAAELLFTGRNDDREEGSPGASTTGWSSDVLAEARRWRALAERPDLRPWHHQDPARRRMEREHREAIEMEAQAQAICMETNDFKRAYEPSRRSEVQDAGVD
jgi:enoyl-CoA hydratase/carnithine racemase